MIPIAVVALVGYGLYRLAKYAESKRTIGTRDVIDCSAELSEYYESCVCLSRSARAKLAKHRNANRTRIKNALRSAGLPRPLKFIPQGSYAMDTLVKAPDNDYDIDDGVVFTTDSLVGPRGRTLTALDARKLVLACLSDGIIAPELRRNCIRIMYSSGYHVDVPVYRAQSDGLVGLEHAGPEWHRADPLGVTAWFESTVASKSPTSDSQQMRRIVQMLKKLLANRTTWNSPSGFIVSRLVEEVYAAAEGRDDAALYMCMVRMLARLNNSLVVAHPTLPETLTDGESDACMSLLREKLAELLRTLEPIIDSTTSRDQALAAWRNAFNDQYWTWMRDDAS